MLAVEPKAFRALLFLLHNPERLISKEELLNALWGDAAVTEGSLTRCIWLLRRLLEDDTREPRFIETVATVGYRFVCPVEVLEDGGYGGDPAPVSAQPSNEAVQAQRRSLVRWWPVVVPVLLIGAAFAIWVMRRPLPPPHISKFTQITHDGHEKYLVGTDGSRLYIALTFPFSISQVGIGSGEITPIPVPLPKLVSFGDVSPDGSNLLIQSVVGSHGENGLWTFRVPAGPIRRIADESVEAAFSPNGESIIYSTPKGDIYLVRSVGTGTHKLASVGPYAFAFSWSADGEIIRFSHDDKFWQMLSDGSNLHQLILGGRALEGACCGRWTPDGRFFLFLSGDSATGRSQIWAIDERRGFFRTQPAVPIQLTAGPINWSTPIPAKDGKTVFSAGVTLRGELSRFDVQAKEFRPFLGGISAQGLTFSKDGQFVAYVSYPEGILWKANRDGSNPMQLSEPPMNVFMPRWSPDGSQILFSDISSESKIYIISSQGGNPRKLLPEGRGEQIDAHWSADGRKIVFCTSFAGRDPKSQIKIYDLDSQKITTVPGSVGMTSPRWSPDGQFIAANSLDKETENIFEVATQRWTALHFNLQILFPEWSRNSQFIYFHEGWPENQGVYRLRVKGGQIEKVVELKNWHDSGWFGLDPTDAPLLLRDIGSTEIYALTLEQK